MHREKSFMCSLKYTCVWRVETRLVERKYKIKDKIHRIQNVTVYKENFRIMRAIIIFKLISMKVNF